MNYGWIDKKKNCAFSGTNDDDVILFNDSEWVTVRGGAGNDIIYMQGGCHNSLVLAGDGNDYVKFVAYSGWQIAKNARISCGKGNDTVSVEGVPNARDFYVQGDDGDDIMNIRGGLDTILGGAGNDTIIGNAGNDLLYGNDGNDVIWGDNTNSKSYDAGNDSIWGGAGNDVIYGQLDDDYLVGEAGNDRIDGGSGNDTLLGGAGNDTLLGGTGNDSLFGNDGNDFIWAGDGNDSVWGGNGRDKIYGQGGADVLVGEAGNDTLYGGGGNDSLTGDAADLPVSLHGADFLVGGDGNDTAWGGAGNDTLAGGTGADCLYGGKGNDKLYGSGSGADGSRDVYVYYKGDGVDKVMDFESGVDVVYLPNARFTRAKMVGRDLYAFVGNNRGIIISNAAGKTIQYCDASTNNRIRAIRL